MTRTSRYTGIALAALLVVGCKKNEKKEADPVPAAAPTPAAEEVVADTDRPPAAASDADCKSIKEFKSVEACVALCDGGNANACYVAGSESLVNEEEPKAAELFTKGCDKGSPFACKWLAPMHHNGLGGIPKDEAKAKELTDKARSLYPALCDAGDMQACVDLAGLIKDTDPAKAKELFQKGCDAGWKGACDQAK